MKFFPNFMMAMSLQPFFIIRRFIIRRFIIRTHASLGVEFLKLLSIFSKNFCSGVHILFRVMLTQTPWPF